MKKESLELLYGLLMIEIEENKQTMRELMVMYGNDPVFYMNSPTYKERESRRDLLAETMCRVNQELELIKWNETVTDC